MDGPRRLVVAVLLLSVPLTGCIGSSSDGLDTQSGEAIEPLPELPRLGAPAALPQNVYAAEPNIAVLDEETVFVTAPVGAAEKPNTFEGAAWLWRSTDAGETWEVLRKPTVSDEPIVGQVAPYGGVFCSCDADVVTSPDGWTYYSDWWIAGLAGPGNYLVEASPDGGETWQAAPVTIPHPGSVDRQWLVAGEDGFVGLFYSYFGTVPVTGIGPDTPVNGRAIQAVFSQDHGQTWSLPVDVVAAGPGEAFQIAHPRLLPDGTLVMPYGYVDIQEDFWTDPSEVRVAISTDQGQTWEQVTAAEVPDGFDNLWAVQGATDEDGNAYVAWAARTGETMTAFVAESTDGARTWGEPEPLRAKGLNFLPWVTATGNGTVAVGWYGGNATGDPTEAGDDATWHAYLAERAGPDEPWAVGKVDDPPVMVGPMCPKGASCGGDRELLDYVSLDYAPSGRLHYAFARSGTVDGVDLEAQVYYSNELEVP